MTSDGWVPVCFTLQSLLVACCEWTGSGTVLFSNLYLFHDMKYLFRLCSFKCFKTNTLTNFAGSTLVHILNWLCFGLLSQLIEYSPLSPGLYISPHTGCVLPGLSLLLSALHAATRGMFLKCMFYHVLLDFRDLLYSSQRFSMADHRLSPLFFQLCLQ